MRFISSLVTQGSGVMGNLVVEKNGVIRTRNIPTNPATAFQTAVRTALAAAAQAWRDILTGVQRVGWNSYAATVVKKDVLGKNKVISGIDCYVAYSAAATQGGGAPISAPPALTGLAACPAVTAVVVDDSANTATFTFADVVSDVLTLNLSLSPGPVSHGRASYAGPYRFHSAVAATGTTSVVFTGVTVPVTGQQLGWRLKGWDDIGRVTNDQDGLTTVVA